MHDASEAYLPDMPPQFKDIFVQFRPLEDKVLSVIAERYGLLWPIPEDVKRQVKDIDKRMLATERVYCMNPSECEWETTRGIQPDRRPIDPISPTMSEAAFVHMFDHLFNGVAT